MKIFALAAALLLPLASLVAADTSTTTLTSTMTLTKTVFLHRVATETAFSNGTNTYPTGTGGNVVGPGPKNTGAPISSNAGSSLQVAGVAMAGVAGMVVAALM